jgi:hypothetical protein
MRIRVSWRPGSDRPDCDAGPVGGIEEQRGVFGGSAPMIGRDKQHGSSADNLIQQLPTSLRVLDRTLSG